MCDHRKEPLFHKEVRDIKEAMENVCKQAEAQHPTMLKAMTETGQIVGNDMRQHLAQSIIGAKRASAMVTDHSRAILGRLFPPSYTPSASESSSSGSSYSPSSSSAEEEEYRTPRGTGLQTAEELSQQESVEEATEEVKPKTRTTKTEAVVLLPKMMPMEVEGTEWIKPRTAEVGDVELKVPLEPGVEGKEEDKIEESVDKEPEDKEEVEVVIGVEEKEEDKIEESVDKEPEDKEEVEVVIGVKEQEEDKIEESVDKEPEDKEDVEVLIKEEVQVLAKECCVRRPGLGNELSNPFILLRKQLPPSKFLFDETGHESVAAPKKVDQQTPGKLKRKKANTMLGYKSLKKKERKALIEKLNRDEVEENDAQVILVPKQHQCCSGKCMRTVNTSKPDDECPYCMMEKTPHVCCDGRCEERAGVKRTPDETGKKVCCSGTCERPRTNPEWAPLYENALSTQLNKIAKEEAALEEALKHAELVRERKARIVETTDAITEPGKPKQTKEDRKDFIRRRIEWKKKKIVMAKEAKESKLMEKKEDKRLKKMEEKDRKMKKKYGTEDEEEPCYKIVEEECCKGICESPNRPPWTAEEDTEEENENLEKRVAIIEPGVASTCPTCHEYIPREEGVCCKEERECCKKDTIIVRKIIKVKTGMIEEAKQEELVDDEPAPKAETVYVADKKKEKRSKKKGKSDKKKIKTDLKEPKDEKKEKLGKKKEKLEKMKDKPPDKKEKQDEGKQKQVEKKRSKGNEGKKSSKPKDTAGV